MDLSAIAGSPAVAALQAFAPPPSTGPTPAQSDSASRPAPTASAGAGANLYAVSQAIGQALSAADAASSAGQTVLGLLDQMKDAAAQASGTDLGTAGRQTLDQTFQAGMAQIAPTLQAAVVGGVNLVDGAMQGALKTSLGDGAQANLDAIDLSAGGPILSLGGANLATPQAAAAAQTAVDGAAQAATGALGVLGAQAAALAGHGAHLQSLGQAVASDSTGVGDDGARLLALQVSQQLSGQAASIANAAPQQVLALFR